MRSSWEAALLCVSLLPEFPRLKGNSVYFAERQEGRDQPNVEIYSLKDGSIKLIPVAVPAVIFPRPAWIVPGFSPKEE